MITVHNNKEIPFGIFSSRYNYYYTVGNIQYKNIYEYLMSGFQDSIDQNPEDAWKTRQRQIIISSMYRGIEAKSKDNSFVRNLLLSKKKRILYSSDDYFIGANRYTQEGSNVYGKALTSYKEFIQKGDNIDIYYEYFVLERLLNYAMYKESLEYYLKLARDSKTTSEIINILQKKYNNEIYIPQKSVVEKLRRNNTVFSMDPEEIILDILSQSLRKVRSVNLNILRNDIFRKFIQEIIDDTNSQYSVDNFIQKLSTTELNYSIERVYLEYLKIIDKSPSKKIDTNLYIPSEEEIKTYENFSLPDKGENYIKNNYFIIKENSILDINDTSVIFKIDDKEFPSISHYVLYSLGIQIPNFDPYIYIAKNNRFLSVTDSRKKIMYMLNNYKKDYFNNRLREALGRRIYEMSNLIDDHLYYIKLTNGKLKFQEDLSKDINNISEEIYNKRLSNIKINMNKVTESLDSQILKDNFFRHYITSKLINLINILNIIYPKQSYHSDLIKVYNSFYNSIGEFYVNEDIVGPIAFIYNIKLNKESSEFLNQNLVSNILLAEKFGKEILERNSKIITFGNIPWITKFFLIESQARMQRGELIPKNFIYSNSDDKETFAMIKTYDCILKSFSGKIVPSQKEVLDMAFKILNSDTIKCSPGNYTNPVIPGKITKCSTYEILPDNWLENRNYKYDNEEKNPRIPKIPRHNEQIKRKEKDEKLIEMEEDIYLKDINSDTLESFNTSESYRSGTPESYRSEQLNTPDSDNSEKNYSDLDNYDDYDDFMYGTPRATHNIREYIIVYAENLGLTKESFKYLEDCVYLLKLSRDRNNYRINMMQ
jgi:predicted NAD-dependent protein-ADP-ribosyltransferase YbiA (DUF1768 family)